MHPPGRPCRVGAGWLDAATAAGAAVPARRRAGRGHGGHSGTGRPGRRAVGGRGHPAAGGPDRRAPVVRGRGRPARPRRPRAPARGVDGGRATGAGGALAAARDPPRRLCGSTRSRCGPCSPRCSTRPSPRWPRSSPSAGEPVPVLLTGGVARCPLLAERVDAAGFAADVRVAPRPDLAAVLGALTLGPAAACRAGGRARALPPRSAARASRPSDARAAAGGARPLAAALVGGLAGAGTAVAMPVWAPRRPRLPRCRRGPRPVRLPRRPPGRVGAHRRAARAAAQPAHPRRGAAGHRPHRRRAHARSATTRPPSRNGRRPRCARRSTSPSPQGARLSGYGAAEVGGRPVTTYRQQERDGAVVEWFVVLDGDAQLSVGCRHTPAGTDVRAGRRAPPSSDRVRGRA